MSLIGRGFSNRRFQNPGIARKGGGGLTHAKNFLVDLIKCTKANLKCYWAQKSDKFAPKNYNFPKKVTIDPQKLF